MKRTKTLKVRVRDKHAKGLNAMARSVNFVWNYINELSERAIRERGLFLSGYNFHAYTAGAARELGLHSQTVQRIGMEYAVRRRRPGPEERGDVQRRTEAGQQAFLPQHGRQARRRTTRRQEKRVRAIHAKIRNRRKDAARKFLRRLVSQYGRIVVGDVDAIKLAKTRMAKSVLDAGWGQLKSLLAYKCDHAGIEFKEVDERYTTQTCSRCGRRPDARPRGIAGLGIREWTCACGVTHDRDINAARNILALGHERPAEEIPVL